MTASIVEHCKAAVFTVADFQGARGTAVAIRSNLLITCHHVVKEFADKIYLANHNSVFEGKKLGGAEIVGFDERLDLALLRSGVHLPTSLQLEDGKTLDDSTPLLVWSWPGWNAWEEGENWKTMSFDPVLHPSHHAAVMTDSWTENNISQFSFGGHIEGGMSGGVVVSALSGKIVGIVTHYSRACTPETALRIAAAWFLGERPHDLSYQELQERLEPRPTIVKHIEAQLRLGIGIALHTKEVGIFLESIAPEIL